MQEQGKRIESENYVEGFATTFNQPYVLFEEDGIQFKEQVDRHALDGADMSDVIMQYDHSGKVMARMSNGTLIVEPQDGGLFVAADLSKSKEARGLFEEIQNGLIRQMSWGFIVDEDSYDVRTHTRTILKVRKVFDVSAVSIPANPSTTIATRNYFDGVIEEERKEIAKREAEARSAKIKALKLMLEVQ